MDSIATEAVTAGPDLASELTDEEIPTDSSAADRRERVGKATFAITLLHLAGRFFGLIEAKLVSSLAGSSIGGIYFAAGALPWAIFNFVEQLLTHAFLPPFVRSREERGEESAWRLASVAATVLAIILFVIVGLGMYFTPQLLGLFSKFDPASLRLETSLARLMLPAVLVMSLSSLTYVLLNAYKQFALPALGDAALKIGVVVCGVVLWRFMGIRAFALGLLIGACLKLTTHLIGLRRPLRLFRPTLDRRDPGWNQFLLLMAPLLAGNILSFVRPLLDVYFSGPREQVAALNFAVKLTNLPFMLIPYAMSIALFPFLAELAARGDRETIGRALVSALRMICFLMLPIAAAYLILGQPLIETIYLGGKFTTTDTGRVLAPLVWYAVGILPLAIETVVLQIFFALSDTKTPTLIAYCTFLLYCAAAWTTTRYLGWGAGGVALAFTLSKLVKDMALLKVLGPRVRGLKLGGFGVFLGKLIACTTVMSLVLWGTLRFGYHTSTGLGSAITSRSAVTSTPTTAAALPAVPAPSITAAHGVPPAGASAAGRHHSAKKPSKTKAIVVFGACALPGALAFLLMAHWLQIPELSLAWGILDRRARPLIRRIALFAMAPW